MPRPRHPRSAVFRELLVGPDPRPFRMTAHQASILHSALDDFMERYQRIMLEGGPRSPQNAQADSEVLADAADLQRRLDRFMRDDPEEVDE